MELRLKHVLTGLEYYNEDEVFGNQIKKNVKDKSEWLVTKIEEDMEKVNLIYKIKHPEKDIEKTLRLQRDNRHGQKLIFPRNI